MNKSDDLLKVGLTKNKIFCIVNIAKHFHLYPTFGNDLSKLNDERIRERLQLFKGIGPWTADMFLIFYLMRPNVLPINDIGIHKSIRIVYDLDGYVDVHNFIKSKDETWSPWKTVVAWYLWRQIDSEPIIY